MQEFIDQLIERKKAELADGAANTNDFDQSMSLTTLSIARASLDKLSLSRTRPEHPLQLAIIGPTQVGKSTLVNLLLQQPLAESHATAGFTVHCQGFHVTTETHDLYSAQPHWASDFFNNVQITDQKSLDRSVSDEYSLAQVSITNSIFNDTVVWDTPDFDSIESLDYRAPLLQLITLADLVVFIVSKEKYADRTVWTMLEMLAARDTPVLMVINKTQPDVRDELKASFDQKYRALNVTDKPPEVTFIGEYFDSLHDAADSDELMQLRHIVREQMVHRSVEDLRTSALRFINHHWSGWTSGVVAEHRSRRQYAAMVELIADETMNRYRSEYIDADRHKEVFQLALSELLVLLEVPGMAKPLSKVRSVVTWPVRTLMSAAKESDSAPRDDRNEERRLLDELCKHSIASLAASLAALEIGAEGHVWKRVRLQVQGEEDAINAAYTGELEIYQSRLQIEIESAAQSLFENLKKQPTMLHSLRAARVTADAAAVVLAVKSGGLGAVDLVIAPAMLSLTTLLAEGALGQYMQKVQQQLTDYQENHVQSLIQEQITLPLLSLYPQLANTSGESISEQALHQATQKLERGDV